MDDLYGAKLSSPPATVPVVRGAAVVMVTVALATSLGCGPSNPGAPLDAITPGVDGAPFDAGFYPVDTGPLAMDSGLAPGVPAQDSGPDIDTGNPGDHP